MRSSSAEPGAAVDADGRSLASWARLVLGALLVAVGLGAPAVALASAQFGSTEVVTISITVGPTEPAPTGPAPAEPVTPAPTATLAEPVPLP